MNHNDMLEKRLERRLRDKVRRLGGLCYKLTGPERGMPDRLVLFPEGLVFLVELKRPGGKLSEVQKEWHAEAAKRGTKVIVLSSEAEVDAWCHSFYDYFDSLFPELTPEMKAHRNAIQRRNRQRKREAAANAADAS